MSGLQEGAGLPGHLRGHRDYGGPSPVRQGSQGTMFTNLYSIWKGGKKTQLHADISANGGGGGGSTPVRK